MLIWFLEAGEVDDLATSLNLNITDDNKLLNATQLEPLEYAYTMVQTASYRGEMRLSTRASALNRGYEFYNPYDPNYNDRAISADAESERRGDTGIQKCAWRNK